MLLKNFLVDEMKIAKGSVKLPIKSLIETQRERYEEMAQDTTRPFSHMVYHTSPGNRLIVHVKVPSRSLTKFYYDVLLELEPTPGAVSFGDCNVKIFSNSPSFVYTYAYVFYHLDVGDESPAGKRKSRTGMIIDTFSRKIPRDRLLMPGTESKIGKKVLNNEPSTRNPLGLPYLDSSIYAAIFYLEDVTTLPQVMAQKNYRTEAQIFNSVLDFNRLMAERKKVAAREKASADRKRRSEEKAAQQVEKDTASANRRGLHIVKPTAPRRAVNVIKPMATKSTRIRKPTHIG